MLITKASLDALRTSLNMSYKRGFDEASLWSDSISMEVSSNSATNTYGWMAEMPSMREWVGPRVVHNMSEYDYIVPNRDFELTIGVKRKDVEDENLGIYAPMAADMGAAARRWRDELMLETLQGGKVGSLFDSKPFFSATHDLSGANQSNLFTTTALSAANYAATRQSMMSYQNAQGRSLGIMPNLLLVPPQLEDEARTILNAEMVASSSGNAGVTNVYRNSAQLKVVPQLSGEPTVWYLADMSRPIKPLVFQNRKAPKFVARTREDSENVFSLGEYQYGVDSRGAGAYGLWFLMARCEA